MVVVTKKTPKQPSEISLVDMVLGCRCWWLLPFFVVCSPLIFSCAAVGAAVIKTNERIYPEKQRPGKEWSY